MGLNINEIFFFYNLILVVAKHTYVCVMKTKLTWHNFISCCLFSLLKEREILITMMIRHWAWYWCVRNHNLCSYGMFALCTISTTLRRSWVQPNQPARLMVDDSHFSIMFQTKSNQMNVLGSDHKIHSLLRRVVQRPKFLWVLKLC